MLTFHKITPAENAAEALLNALLEALERKKRTLWLVPGGSNIPLSVEIMNHIPADLTANMVIMLTDERYGELNHPDSNMLQLARAGFHAKKATLIPSLLPNKSLQETAEYYGQTFNKARQMTNIIIGQFGIGADGHIAGIKPRSPAVTGQQLAVGYQAEDFTRITLTPLALAQINEAFAFVYGDEKRDALERLKSENLPMVDQPSQILKVIPKSHVYNDQIEGQAKEL